MASKITGLVIINQQGTTSYYVGSSYRGMCLAEIRDNSIDAPENYVARFQ